MSDLELALAYKTPRMIAWGGQWEAANPSPRRSLDGNDTNKQHHTVTHQVRSTFVLLPHTLAHEYQNPPGYNIRL